MSKFVSTAGLLVSSTAILAAAIFVAEATAQTSESPPDFSSANTDKLVTAWGRPGGVNFEPVPGSPPPITQDPAYPYYSNGTARRLGVLPTYRLADLTHPNLKQWAKDVMKTDKDEVIAGKYAYTPGSSCKLAGVPDFVLDGGPFFFVQTTEKIWIYTQGNMRQIHMNVPHSANPKPSWFGESVGHYEGDTLVIDTIGLNTKTFVDHFRTPHTEKLHVIERWRMVDDGNGMEVVVTIDDPYTFNQPWKGMVRYSRVQEEMTEYSCVEGNLLLFDWGVPEADKADF